jgi:hypothetical protein
MPDKYRSGEGIVADGQTQTPCSATVKTQEGELVPDGTEVTFTTTHGSFDPETATTTDGVASSTLTSPELEADADGLVTVTADGAEAEVDVKWVGVKVELQIPDQGTMGGVHDFQFTVTYSKCLYIDDMRVMLYNAGVWLPMGGFYLVEYAVNGDGGINATFGFAVDTRPYQNRQYHFWFLIVVRSPGGHPVAGDPISDPPADPGDPGDYPPGYDDPPSDDGDIVAPTIGNLCVKHASVSPQSVVDYFMYDPEGPPEMQEVSFSFDIEDEGDPHQYEWIVYFWNTDRDYGIGDADGYLMGTVTAPGTVSVTFNGLPNNGEGGDQLPAGCYTFDVYVDEYEDAAQQQGFLDEAEMKTQYRLTLGDHSCEFVGHDDGNRDAVVSLHLQDAVGDPATRLEIDLIDPLLNVVQHYVYPSETVPVNEDIEGIVLKTFGADERMLAGQWRAVFCAEDSHGGRERDLENNRMLSRNALPFPHRSYGHFVPSEVSYTEPWSWSDGPEYYDYAEKASQRMLYGYLPPEIINDGVNETAGHLRGALTKVNFCFRDWHGHVCAFVEGPGTAIGVWQRNGQLVGTDKDLQACPHDPVFAIDQVASYHYNQLGLDPWCLAFVLGCSSNKPNNRNICNILRSHTGHKANVYGTTHRMSRWACERYAFFFFWGLGNYPIQNITGLDYVASWSYYHFWNYYVMNPEKIQEHLIHYTYEGDHIWEPWMVEQLWMPYDFMRYNETELSCAGAFPSPPWHRPGEG